MAEKASRNSANHNNNSRILSGHGTHNRPWIVEDDEVNGSTNDRSSSRASSQLLRQQQQQRQQMIRQNIQGKIHETLSASEHGGAAAPNNNIDRMNTHVRHVGEAPIHSGDTTANHDRYRRASTSDIKSVASEDSGSSYDRYLAQKRASKEKQKEQHERQKVDVGTVTQSNIRQSSTQRHSVPITNEPRRSRTTTASSSSRAQPPPSSVPVSPILEKHYTNDGKANLLAPSKRDVSTSARRRFIGATIPIDIQNSNSNEQDDSKQSMITTTTGPSFQSASPADATSTTTSNRTRRTSFHADEEVSTNTTSRDLRARRLVASQQSRGAASKIATTQSSDSIGTETGTKTVPLHFQAHDAAVEKYLMRSRLNTDPGRSRLSIRNQDGSTTTESIHPEPQQKPWSSTLATSTRIRSDGNAPVNTPHHNSSTISGNEKLVDGMRTVSNPTQQTNGDVGPKAKVGLSYVESQKLSDATPDESQNGGPVISTQTGWSTMKPASSTGYHNVTTDAIAAHDAYKVETSRVLAPVASLGSGSSKVDEYLAQRNALKVKVESFSRLGMKLPDAMETDNNSTPPILSVPSTSVSLDESADDDESNEEESDTDSDASVHVENIPLDDEYMDDSGQSNPTKEWGIKVCVISAVDFPVSVVPNLPFSPMLKLGLIKIDTDRTTDQGCRELEKVIERDGLSTIPLSRVRCTSSKILSKRDNGSVEFHEEVRWNRVHEPQHAALALELSSRAVLPPANFRESPQQQKVGPFILSPPIQSNVTRPNTSVKQIVGKETTASVIGSMFRNIRKSDSAEMEEANAAAAVAKHLVHGGISESSNTQSRPFQQSKSENQSEVDVRLRRLKSNKRLKMSEEFRIGSKVIPLSVLALGEAMQRHETVRIEQWFELDTCTNTVKRSLVGTNPCLSATTRNPSILLEISFSSRAILDESEDDDDESDSKVEKKASYSKRASLKIRKQLKQEVKPKIEKAAEPMLEPGIIDFICVVGARDIGDQRNDDGSSGWVNSTPDCCILEQFPPDDEFHAKRGRNAVLAGKIEWFCFPEGCKLWRGLTPPNHDELNLKRFSASTSGNIASSIASFDASLGCTTSFSWFVIASSSDKYGSENKKTYCAVIRFYVPAPAGIDPTQDDFAQTYIGNTTSSSSEHNDVKRLWVPIGICMTSSLPIVGTMEVMLLRLCDSLSTSGFSALSLTEEAKAIREALVCAIVSFQKPIPGVVNCSFPFLKGELLHVAIPSRTGLPPLPHGRSVSAVCRLLGADGLNFLLAAFLTECKIILHSDEVANLSMVAEVLTALIYPFEWALPYIPVLPAEMMEFIEAPVSFMIGVPSCNMCHADPIALEDVVVVDLDRDFATSDYFEGRRNGLKTKSPIPLPAAVASNIAKATHRLVRANDESLSLPRIEPETLAEKEFRVAVALEVCGLIRGFDECLVFSSSQPVFNVDKFLQIAPSIFEEQRETSRDHGHVQGSTATRNVISPRSRRFVSSLVCCQHFHQFLDVLEAETLTFFHVIMRALYANKAKKEKSLGGMLLALESNQGASDLCKMLLKVEDKTPTYRVKSLIGQWGTVFENHATESGDSSISHFPINLLQQINIHEDAQKQDSGQDGLKSVSIEYLVELEKNPWRYRNVLNLSAGSTIIESSCPAIETVKLREAIGDRRYKAWKAGYDKFDGDDGTIISEDTMGVPNSLDLRNLLAAAANNVVLNESENDRSATVNAKDRETLRRCLEYSQRSSQEFDDMLQAAEIALRNPASKTFILSILSQRIPKDEKRKNETTPVRRRSLHYGGSKIDASLFHLLLRLSFAMLDSCDETNDFESAYQLLKHTAGLYAAINESGNEVNVVYVTERIGLHPIYGNLTLWENVKATHSAPRQKGKLQKDSNAEDVDDEYEAVVATLYEMNGYGIPAKDLARFASRMCYRNGWFHSEKGQTILMLAKRVCVRRDGGTATLIPSTLTDFSLISSSRRMGPILTHRNQSRSFNEDYKWIEVGWCHPAAQSSRRMDPSRRAGQNVPANVGNETASLSRPENEKNSFMKRSAVTSMSYLGSSVVVTGGLDGGVFLARTVRCSTSNKPNGVDLPGDGEYAVRGLHLDWGSSGSRYAVGSTTTTMDGEYGVGAVTCLTATKSMLGGILPDPSTMATKDVFDEPLADEEVLESMEGCRVVAGTTCGDLRVWSIRDVFTAVFYANRSASDTESGSTTTATAALRSGKVQSRGTDFAAGTSLTRLKFSLRGRALSGHRGGVSCIIVHSNVYRPDSIVSGGADGLIKLWSLRTPGTSGGRRSSVDPAAAGSIASSSLQYRTATGPNGGIKGGTSAASTGDALSILSGHGGRILCIKTAWHGDRLLSGGADRTVRLWDLAAGSGGKCLNTLTGHFGWVTNVDYWGQNTIVSASTDRSIGLWDVRIGNTPLFILRHHYAPISNLLLEPHCDATLISSATDGSVASWDLRQLTSASKLSKDGTQSNNRGSETVRTPSAILQAHKHKQQSYRRPETSLGPVHLTKGVSLNRKTVQCLGGDTVIREWDYRTGEVVREQMSGHCDTVSSFVALAHDTTLGTHLESVGSDYSDASISASWDGTVRLRNRVAK